MSGFRSTHSRRSDRYRSARRGVMHARDASRQNSKHMRRWRIADPNTGMVYDMLTPERRICGGINTGEQHPVESRATAPLPWKTRPKTRARNRAAKASRKRNR